VKNPTIRVLVADDHTIVRRGVVSLLSLAEGIEVVAEAENGREAVEKSVLLEPDVVLMDVSMPLLNGLEATTQIRTKAPRVRVLILSAHDNEEYLLQVAESGASGYLLKNSSAEELFRAIRSVHEGGEAYSPSLPVATRGEGPVAAKRLTSREREILQLVAEGNHHQRIADLLNISLRTVDTHCNNIMRKLDLHDRASLATYAIKNGIVILPK
jgi:two-component system nitrate/nitrite response regulator NarL